MNMDNKKPNIIGIVPARMGSSRFPGKALAPILGMPMIGHCYFRTRMCGLLDDVYIATCDQEIKDYAESIGAKVVMTADTHERAMDRSAEAVAKIEKEMGEKIDLVVQMQGDEPMVTKEMLESSIRKMMADESINIMNLVQPITDQRDLEIPDVLKVVTDKKGNMLYYSRSLVPYDTKKFNGKVPYLKTIGIHLFRKEFLFEFMRMEPTPLEIIESTDMLRILEHGLPISTFKVETPIWSVDTPADLKFVEEKMAGDPLLKSYAKKQ